MNEKESINLIKSLVDVNEESIKINDDGFLSRGYVIDNGRIVFKFPRKDDVKYENEIEILNFINSLNLGINLQKVGWVSDNNSYLGIYGVVGKSLEGQRLSSDQKINVGKKLGTFLKKLHIADKSNISKLTLDEEISSWQQRYDSTKNFIRTEFSDDEQILLENLIKEYMPKALHSYGEKLVLSHGDLGDGNIFIDEYGKIGVIDFNSSGYFEEAADFMDVSDDELRDIMLNEYGASEELKKKVELRKDIRPIIVLNSYLERGGQEVIRSLDDKIRHTLKKYTQVLS